MDNHEAALQAHQASIRNNPHSVVSLKACADIYRKQETRDGYMRVRTQRSPALCLSCDLTGVSCAGG